MKNEVNLDDLQIKKDQVLDELTSKYIYGGDITIILTPVYKPKIPIITCMPPCVFIATPASYGG